MEVSPPVSVWGCILEKISCLVCLAFWRYWANYPWTPWINPYELPLPQIQNIDKVFFPLKRSKVQTLSLRAAPNLFSCSWNCTKQRLWEPQFVHDQLLRLLKENHPPFFRDSIDFPVVCNSWNQEFSLEAASYSWFRFSLWSQGLHVKLQSLKLHQKVQGNIWKRGFLSAYLDPPWSRTMMLKRVFG